MTEPGFRAFVAIDLGDLPRVDELTRVLPREAAGLRVVPPENLHVTLRFLGTLRPEAQPKVEAAIRESVREASPFDVIVRGLGVFPERGAGRVLWAGLFPREPLVAIAKRLGEALAALGTPPGDDRPFTPHLTLARSKGGDARLNRFAALYADFEGGAGRAEEIRLMRSDLSREGPRYSVVSSATLGAPA